MKQYVMNRYESRCLRSFLLLEKKLEVFFSNRSWKYQHSACSWSSNGRRQLFALLLCFRTYDREYFYSSTDVATASSSGMPQQLVAYPIGDGDTVLIFICQGSVLTVGWWWGNTELLGDNQSCEAVSWREGNDLTVRRVGNFSHLSLDFSGGGEPLKSANGRGRVVKGSGNIALPVTPTTYPKREATAKQRKNS